MSCCGSPRDKTNTQQNANPSVTPYHINQQPGPSPAPHWPNQEKQFHPSGIPSPPLPIQPQMTGYSNGNAMHPPSMPSHPGSPFQQPPSHQQNGSISNYNPYAQGPPNPPSSPPAVQAHGPAPTSQFGSISGIQRPSPVLANGFQSESYQPQNLSVAQAAQPQTPGSLNTRHSTQSANQNDGKLVVSIDFGTTMSGVAYGSTRIAGGKVQQVLHWPGTQDTYRKIPTCLIYDERGVVQSWGVEAKSAGPVPGTYKCEWVCLVKLSNFNVLTR